MAVGRFLQNAVGHAKAIALRATDRFCVMTDTGRLGRVTSDVFSGMGASQFTWVRRKSTLIRRKNF